MMSRSFSGKVAAITGAASGMGRSLAVMLAERGCELALSDVDEKGLAETAAKINGAKVTTRKLDVANGDDIRAWAAEVVRDHGKVNLLFNNAGISYGATVGGCPEDEFRKIMDIDFWGVVIGTQAFLPHLEASGDGHIVNTSSLFGLIGFPGQCAYTSAKFAVRGFTETLRVELEMTGSCVSATCVHPGGIKTNIARASGVHPSVATLGVNIENASRDFEQNFRVSADEAAAVILRGVVKNHRRVLIGADARIMDFAQRLLPGSYHGFFGRFGKRLIAANSAKGAKNAIKATS
ncbi:MAG: SDR family NAD(P)-dependent oxidoreductase [Polyangiaceae bacterium]